MLFRGSTLQRQLVTSLWACFRDRRLDILRAATPSLQVPAPRPRKLQPGRYRRSHEATWGRSRCASGSSAMSACSRGCGIPIHMQAAAGVGVSQQKARSWQAGDRGKALVHLGARMDVPPLVIIGLCETADAKASTSTWTPSATRHSAAPAFENFSEVVVVRELVFPSDRVLKFSYVILYNM